jgi:CHAT domain-containing protein
VPFAALYDTDGFLVEHYAIAVEPALGLIVRRPHTLGGRTLVAGLSSATAAGAGLRNVAGEVRDVADRRGATQLLDADFTHAAFLRELGDPTYTVVHIASHAHFDVDAENTKITAIDTPLSPDEMGEAIRGARKEGLELLVLSACDTAASDTDRAVLGLAGLAVQSGARSALGTLWRANDQAASALMAEFYRALPSASSKAAALQTAQLALLKRPLYRHPNEWSPFMILGDWQ